MSSYVIATKDGNRKVDLLESVTCRAKLGAGATQNPDGSFNVEYDGGSDMFWDEQRPVVQNGYDTYIDSDGNEYTHEELHLVTEDEAAD